MKEHGGFTGVELANIAAMQMKLKEYEAIGALEECRAAIEKQKPKKPIEQHILGLSGRGGKCPSCKHYLDRDVYAMYCNCG